jgi:transcriptional regulator with XRE-family HTH domain
MQTARLARGLSQTQAAKILATHKDYVSRLERGVVNPGRIMLEKMADAYGVTIDQLLGRSPLEAPSVAS